MASVNGPSIKGYKKGWFLVFSYILFFLLFFFNFLKQPFERDLALTITIFALVSYFTLGYIPLINEQAKNVQRCKARGESYDKPSWRKVSLTWTAGMFFFTIIFLIARILWLISDSSNGYLRFMDWNIITSFSIGTVMRIFLFFDSYHKDYWKHIKRFL